ncbi:MAG: DUF4430 domain-containing protein [Halanaerobiales bacterium]
MNNSLRNKVLIVGLVIILAGLGLFAYNRFLSPEGVAGEKAVAINIVIEGEEIDQTLDYDTDYEFLYELIKENQEALGVELKETDFGPMVTGMMDYTAKEEDNEYFHITVNGEDAQTGIKEIVLNDGDSYKFELTSW